MITIDEKLYEILWSYNRVTVLGLKYKLRPVDFCSRFSDDGKVYYINENIGDGDIKYSFDESSGLIYRETDKEGKRNIRISKLLNSIPILVYGQTGGFYIQSGGDLYKKVFGRWCEVLSDVFIAIAKDLDFLISDDVVSIYNLETYKLDDDTLSFSSCMSPSCDDDNDYRPYDFVYLFSYINNLSVVYGTKEGKLLYRALLWDVEVDGVSTKLLDRVYGDRIVEQQLIRWAKNRDYCYREMSSGIIIRGGNEVEVISRVGDHIKFTDYIFTEGCIYLDTMCWYSVTEGYLTNVRSGSAAIEIRSCNGDELSSNWTCDSCGVYFNILNSGAVYDGGNIYCEACGTLIRGNIIELLEV
jgi:hypothetical protein